MELKFRTIFDSASDGITMLDTRQGTFVAANVTLCQMLGYTQEEFLALKISDLHPKEQQKDILSIYNKINHHELSIARNIPILKKDQTLLYADISGSLISLE
ncbi:MAG: PAS domain S-box protein, partial [Deltaproteobacteria bacterium]|nr:PAS domain S-box protein [Deltaproteobacteria bacterium]